MIKQVFMCVDSRNFIRFCLFAAGLALSLCVGLQSFAVAGETSPYARNLSQQFASPGSGPLITGEPSDLVNFSVFPSQPLVGEISDYDLAFRLGKGDYHRLNKGGFVFDFPQGFNLSGITGITITDDHHRSRYKIKQFISAGQSLTITLKRIEGDEGDDDGDDKLASKVSVSLRINQITNPSAAGFYQIVGMAFNKRKDTVSGPTTSAPFEITGTGAGIAGIVLLPEGNQTLPVGDSISFSAWSVDQAGNVIGEVAASWMLSVDSDPIGLFSGSLFTAEMAGIGRVRAVFGDFEAFSGLITVVSSGPSLSYVSGSLSPQVVHAGFETAFGFDVLLDESFSEDATINRAKFTVFSDVFSSSAVLTSESGLLRPGVNHVSSEVILVPQGLVGSSLNVSTEIIYSPVSDSNLIQTFKSDLDNASLSVKPTPVVQIISLESIAYNAPKVNVGQSYRISCKVANLSDLIVTSLALRLSSDGASAFDPELVIPKIAPGDTVEVFYNLTASETPNQQELFVVEITDSGHDQIPPLDNTTFVIIQTPADLEMSYSLLGVTNGTVHQGSVFSLSVELINNGEASASDAQYIVTTEGGDLGAEFDSIGVLKAGEHLLLLFRAPNHETSAVISFALTDSPIDLNTGQEAIVGDTSFQFKIAVLDSDRGLAVDFTRDRINLIMPGRSKRLFSMALANRLEAGTYSIEVKSMSVFLFSDGRPIDAASVFDLNATGFFKGGIELSQLETSGNRLDLALSFLIGPGRPPPEFNFMAVALSAELRNLTLEINLSDIEARYFDGPAVGEPVPISSSGDSKVCFDYVFKGPTLEQSVVIENNPFNPDEELLRFTYELPVLSDVEFRILTLTGEEVYSLDIPFGGQGASQVGENEISWDGRNGEGHTVLNGVYIVFIRILETGESTLTKVAVVK